MGKRSEPLRFVCRGCGEPGETWNTGSKGIYHSKVCRGLAERNGWVSRYRRSSGYISISWLGDDGKIKHIFEHRKVWQDAHGPIPPGYIIHHLNGEKADNRLENLSLMRRDQHGHDHNRDWEQYPERPTHAEYVRRSKQRRKMA